eukprot:10796739-Lingulodinium_polyedra.AAC.1
MVEAVDAVSFMLYVWEVHLGRCTVGLRIDQDAELREGFAAGCRTDCKGLFGSINRNQSVGQLTGKSHSN